MDIGHLNFLLSVIFIKLWHFIHDTKNAAKSLLLISQRILKAELIDFDSFCIFLYHQRWLEHVRLSLNAEQGKIIQRSRQVCFDVNVASTHPSLKLIKTNICLCSRNLNDTFCSRSIFQKNFLLGTEVFSTFFYTLFWTFSNVFSFRYRSLFQNCFLLGTEVFFKSCVFFIYNFFLLGAEVFFLNSFLYFILNFFSFRYSRFFQTCFLLGTEVFFKSCVFFIYNFFLLGTEVVFPKAFSCSYRNLLGRKVFSFRYRNFFF